MPALVTINTGVVVFAVCIGWHSSSVRHVRFDVRPDRPDEVADTKPRDTRAHATKIFGGNVRVVGGLLIGACTLGIETLRNLFWNAFVLGFGLSALMRSSPDLLPQVLRYVPLEFSAFVLAASAGHHLAFTVLRCLAAGETPRFSPSVVVLATALVMLIAAAVIEAGVAQHVAELTP
ncbi:MAG TPA: stage II sporulation protein M [Vicinamibacterales bacterium]|jgi:uncharacterized membrane protein SpoIIM required for sporulation|nr:stage II sporulation protein M [Vicinamibacterales bacterium]HJN44858.1 stage II sporulation protein M [Vicinamibacterales bacterium]|tara:strand:- start:2607 stop:3137 length:531 start_codon:yes stop_codon:yes gene_type:complete